MTYIINVNEITVVQLVILALFRRNPYVLAVDPLFPPSHRLLQAIVDKLIALGRARWVIELCPELDHIWEYNSLVMLYDIFAETEDWQNEYYGFSAAEIKSPDYAYAYKHVVCNYTRKMHFPFLLIKSAIESATPGSIRVAGLTADYVAALENYWGRGFRPEVSPMWVPNSFINSFVSIFLLIFSLLWILFKTRPLGVFQKTFFFAADYLGDPRDIRLYDEVAEGGPILLVIRKAMPLPHSREDLENYQKCKATDGRFTLPGGLAAVAMVVSDGYRLFTHFKSLPPALFFKVAALPYKRAILRAFFTRYRTRFYWGRDDYNAEHILRRQELHKFNGKSMGITHGFPTYAVVFAQWRYINFDQYCVFGLAVYQDYIKNTWAKDMKITVVGSFGASRQDYAKRLDEKPKDIVIFSSWLSGRPDMVHIVRTIANTFQDRKVMLQLKSTFAKTDKGRAYVELCTHGIANIELSTAPVFELFKLARYAFSEPSTVILEALSFNMNSFCIDITKNHKTLILRDFPGLCVHSAEEACERIRAIEDGTWEYPRESYKDLIDISGHIFFDKVREYMGLPTKKKYLPPKQPETLTASIKS